MFKINESIIVIQAEATSPNKTDVVFWSHDRGTAKLRMKLVRKNGIPQSLPEGTTVPIRLMFRSATAEGGYGKHDYLATIEDRVNGIVSIVLEDNILGYIGIVEGSVYIDFPNDRSLDTAGRFTFYIKRSPIDDSTPELENYYFNGFSQTIDKVEKILADGKQEIEKKIAESETQIDAKLKDTNDKITKANQDVATLNTNIDKANDRIDQTNQQIGDLGKLKKMYSNSIDFGDYDYSGRANLMPILDFSKLSSANYTIQTPPPYIKDGGTYFVLDASDASAANTTRNVFIPFLGRLEKGATYMVTIPMMVSEDFGTDYDDSPIYPYNVNDGVTTTRPWLMTPNADCRGKWQLIKKAFTVPSNMSDGKFAPFLHVYQNKNQTGKLYIGYDIKIEKVNSTSDTATPYQPNLLDAPYYLSKIPLGENILKPASFPINTTEYMAANFTPNEPYVQGQKYTFTMKASKPSTQTFGIYLRAGSLPVGNMVPVEGLADVWQLTFEITQSHIDGSANALNVFQAPQSTKGTVNIEWAKLEKGDTRTPNISQFKYFGEGLKDSNSPTDYSWDITPEYTEKALTNTLNLTDPQTALGLKNFKDGAQIDGVDVATVKNLGSVLQSGSGLTTIQSDKQSAFDEFSYEFERIGDRVFFHARVKTNSTTAVASHVNLLEIPLGFQLPIGGTIGGIPLPVVQWTTPQGEISALAITDLTGKQVVKFATNRVGNHYISGEWRTADSYPETK
ncbi:BppU family phage baseplate upper protein [Enterococcus faecium]|nr:BppU family phage baseplate upper protein [Enterococcus faecium]